MYRKSVWHDDGSYTIYDSRVTMPKINYNCGAEGQGSGFGYLFFNVAYAYHSLNLPLARNLALVIYEQYGIWGPTQHTLAQHIIRNKQCWDNISGPNFETRHLPCVYKHYNYIVAKLRAAK